MREQINYPPATRLQIVLLKDQSNAIELIKKSNGSYSDDNGECLRDLIKTHFPGSEDLANTPNRISQESKFSALFDSGREYLHSQQSEMVYILLQALQVTRQERHSSGLAAKGDQGLGGMLRRCLYRKWAIGFYISLNPTTL